MKYPFIAAAALLLPTTLSAHNPNEAETSRYYTPYLAENHRLDIGVSGGSTGIGIDASSNVTDWLRVRVGVDYMPDFTMPLSFSVSSYTEPADGTPGEAVPSGNLDKMKDLMLGLTNVEVDDVVKMDGHPSFWNLKLMLDFAPWQNKHWHVTAGVYYGGSRIGKAVNSIEEMPSLLAVNMYNHFYDFAASGRWFDEPLIPGYDDYYMSQEMAEKFINHGAVGINVGTFKDGNSYVMRPGKDGLVRANCYVNRWRPYLGFGYCNVIDRSGRWTFGFDAGVMMWGGSPKVITHEGVDLSQLQTVRGKLGDYMDIVNTFKVFPSVNFRLAYSIF